MPTFYYSAKTQDGQTKTGTENAKDESDLAQILRQENLVLVSAKSLDPGKEKPKSKSVVKIFQFLKKVSLVEKLMFTRHLSVMIEAGFSLHRALEVLARQTNNSVFKKTIFDLVDRIKKGEGFADSLAKYPKIFNNFYVSMVRVGEKGGNLQEVLKILAQYLKKEHDFRSKVRSAMVYPAVIIVAMIGIAILMMVVVMPKITVMFEDLQVDLPFTTRIVMSLSKFMSKHFIVGTLLIIVLIFLTIKIIKTKKGKKALGWLSIKIPFVKKLIQKINCARFSRSFSSLMNSGVSMVESLIITSQTLDNYFYSKSLMEMTDGVKKGKSLHELMQKYEEIYPILVSQMVAIGEETGELSDIINRLADFYEEEVTNITSNLASIIEPILMIVVGAIVGFFAVSMIQPMYSMMNAL